jgi:hypothetical protein
VAAAPALGLEADAAATVGAAPALDLPTAVAATPTLALNVPATPAAPALGFLATSALDLANDAAAAITLDLDVDMATLNGPLLASGAADPLVYPAELVHAASPADAASLTLYPDALDPATLPTSPLLAHRHSARSLVTLGLRRCRMVGERFARCIQVCIRDA